MLTTQAFPYLMWPSPPSRSSQLGWRGKVAQMTNVAIEVKGVLWQHGVENDWVLESSVKLFII